MSTLSRITTPALVFLAALPGKSEAAEPTEFEQYMLELINRARADPAAEVVRLTAEASSQPGYWGAATTFNLYEGFYRAPSINEGPPLLGGAAYSIPATAKQPLAFNTDMIDTSHAYVLRMQSSNSISHQIGGSSVYDRLTAEGYTTDFPLDSGQNNYFPGSENNSYVATSDSFDTAFYDGDIRKEAIDVMHHGLFTDGSSSTRGHRMTMLASDWQEAGIGVDFGIDGQFSSAYANHTFGVQSGRGPFLTGVVFNDLDSDQFFTPNTGEPIAGILVTVYKTGTAEVVATSTSFSSGGYSIAVPSNDIYDIRFSSTSADETFSGIAVGTENVKVDVIDPGYNPQDPNATTAEPAITGIIIDGADLTITWTSPAGSDYQVFTSTDLSEWIALQGARGTSNESTTSYTHANGVSGSPRRYYRISISS